MNQIVKRDFLRLFMAYILIKYILEVQVHLYISSSMSKDTLFLKIKNITNNENEHQIYLETIRNQYEKLT